MGASRREAGRLTLLIVVILALVSAGIVYWDRVSSAPEDFFQQGNKAYHLRDFYRANLAWQQAHELGHPGATAALAGLYLEGEGVTRNHARAFELYREAAEQGWGPAQLALGDLYAQGRGVAPDPEQAALWYLTAAKNGEPGAQYALGRMYEEGEQVPADAAEAALWYEQAADGGYGEAQLALGRFLEEGRGGPRDPAAAARWLERAAEDADLPEAHFRLAALYEEGRGVGRDEEQAAYHYDRAASQQHVESLYRIGRMLLEGRGVPKNPQQAAAQLRAAASQGHVDAQYLLGQMYERGDGVSKSVWQAKKWYAMAAEEGHVQSIAKLYELGESQQQLSRYEKRRLEKERERKRERLEQEEIARDHQVGHCDIRGTVEMRTRSDCLNRGGSFRESAGGSGRLVTVDTEEPWSKQRRDLARRLREQQRDADRYESAVQPERREPVSSDWVLCSARHGSDSSGQPRYRCSGARRKTADMTTAWCRDRGYQSRRLFKHQSSARAWYSDHCH